MTQRSGRSTIQNISIDELSQYDGPFQIIGSFGTRLVLPPAMADWVKTDPRFNAVDVVKQSMASDLPGFEGLRAPHALTNLIRTNLSTNLSEFIPKGLYSCAIASTMLTSVCNR